MRFSKQLRAHIAARSSDRPFMLGEWLCTLSEEAFNALFRRVTRVMYADEDGVPEGEVEDVLSLAVWTYQLETMECDALDPEEVELLALSFELSLWRESARRKDPLAVDDDLSLVAAGRSDRYVSAFGASKAVARAWAAGARSASLCQA